MPPRPGLFADLVGLYEERWCSSPGTAHCRRGAAASAPTMPSRCAGRRCSGCAPCSPTSTWSCPSRPLPRDRPVSTKTFHPRDHERRPARVDHRPGRSLLTRADCSPPPSPARERSRLEPVLRWRRSGPRRRWSGWASQRPWRLPPAGADRRSGGDGARRQLDGIARSQRQDAADAEDDCRDMWRDVVAETSRTASWSAVVDGTPIWCWRSDFTDMRALRRHRRWMPSTAALAVLEPGAVLDPGPDTFDDPAPGMASAR